MIPKVSFIFDRKGKASKNRASVIELLIYYGGHRKYISTGVSVLPSEWKNGSVVSRKDWRELNEQLQIMKQK